MKKQDALDHFGGIKKLADAIGVYPQAIYQWGPEVPKRSAILLESITKGKLKADEK